MGFNYLLLMITNQTQGKDLEWVTEQDANLLTTSNIHDSGEFQAFVIDTIIGNSNVECTMQGFNCASRLPEYSLNMLGFFWHESCQKVIRSWSFPL